VIDFEALIDNVKEKDKPLPPITNNSTSIVEPKIEIKNEIKEEKKVEKIEPPVVQQHSNNENEMKIDQNMILLQNQNIIDMAMLNNSLLTASLALSPSTSKEALSATAFILNYNNQIINTLSNSLFSSSCKSNLMPYNNELNFPHNSFCDKSNKEVETPAKVEQSVVTNGNLNGGVGSLVDAESSQEETSTSTSDSYSQSSSVAELYYKQLLTYCNAMNEDMPNWYDVNYVYSGLHSIVNPPPENVHLWDSKMRKSYNLRQKSENRRKNYKDDDSSENDKSNNRLDRNGNGRESDTAPVVSKRPKRKKPPECNFCFEQYSKEKCQFYRSYNQDFKVKTYRNGKAVFCECCDYSECDEDDDNAEENKKIEDISEKMDENKEEKDKSLNTSTVIRAGWFGKGELKFVFYIFL
jgi:hypothetical protein